MQYHGLETRGSGEKDTEKRPCHFDPPVGVQNFEPLLPGIQERLKTAAMQYHGLETRGSGEKDTEKGPCHFDPPVGVQNFEPLPFMCRCFRCLFRYQLMDVFHFTPL